MATLKTFRTRPDRSTGGTNGSALGSKSVGNIRNGMDSNTAVASKGRKTIVQRLPV